MSRTHRNQDHKDQRAAARKATINAYGTRGWLPPSRTEPNRKREASRKACRGRPSDDS